MAKRLAPLPKEMNIDIDSKVFNDVYYKYLYTVNFFEVYYGGSGSGKSTWVAQKLALQMTIMDGRNLICLRLQKTDCINSCWAEIKQALKKFKLLQYWEIKENPVHIMVNRVNGNQIRFDGVDNIEDVKSIKFTNDIEDKKGGDNLTDVWYEEVNAEPTSATIKELRRRLRDNYVKSRIILSFNPVSRAHWLYDFVTTELTTHGIDAMILKTTYKDNRFLPKEYGEDLERFKFTSPYDYQVYALGNWGTMGETIFDANKIQLQLDRLATQKFIKYDFLYSLGDNKLPIKDTYRLIPVTSGDITIFKEPEIKHPYVIGIDTAGEGSDYYAGHVMDNISGEQVAVFHSQKKPFECVWQLLGLAYMYNTALMVPEINFDTWIIQALQMVSYRKIYRRVSKADKTHIHKEDKLGWRTDIQTRPMMLSDMVYWTSEHMHCINDVETLNEMLVFTRQDRKLKGVWMGAEAGEHDDLTISLGITLQGRQQQSCEMIPEVEELKGVYLREEIDDLIDTGVISRKTALDYVNKHGYYGEKDERIERGNRYARR